ncbi:MAG: SirB2 family protein [Bacteroidia bacterium]|nr:SirB2 family protein [Bacteroidia bacterium]
MLFKAALHLHLTSVILFLLLYIVKTYLLVSNKDEQLQKIRKTTRIPEMIISTLFLVTGVYMAFNYPLNVMFWIKMVFVFASIPLAVIAYKRNNKALAVVSLLMIIAAYGCAEMIKKQNAKPITAVATTSVDTDINAHEIYTSNCANCHGEQGNLMLAGATNLQTSTLTQPEMVMQITNGKGAMPAFGEQLNDAQINAVAEYIVTLRK